ncbi:MFS transporter [Pseudoxanthomonas sp. SGNA-20]|uniref:MFS transporter n=1 Tax=Pseudoxanthomonas sp. SGNA-20 TaxID=2493088 RepID=UPI000F63E0A3|nr:MFS transporter [Pseudoxanthomonas sp. SGNA-20]RRN57284.1 MFS transporter [Pseudoxanthomonas sp. SGNA-20]
MENKGLPPRATAALYGAAGVLFILGAVHGGRPGFSAVGVACLALVVLVWLRRDRGNG